MNVRIEELDADSCYVSDAPENITEPGRGGIVFDPYIRYAPSQISYKLFNLHLLANTISIAASMGYKPMQNQTSGT